MHLASPQHGLLCTSAIVGSTIPAAVGTAFANRRLKNGKVCAVFFGDGALETGDFWESLNLACAWRLPVLFVCEDNGYAVHTPSIIRQGFDHVVGVMERFRCSVRAVEGTDVEAVVRVAQATLQTLPAGPAFLHILTYRYLDHIGIEEDFEAGYRTREEAETWRKRDPLDRQRRRLLEQGMPEEAVRTTEREIELRLAQALKTAQDAPPPAAAELHAGVFEW